MKLCLAVVLMVAAAVRGQDPALWDCRRLNFECKFDGVCRAADAAGVFAGTCDCTAAAGQTAGDANPCADAAAATCSAAELATCDATGTDTCLSLSSAVTCYCKDGYMGTACDQMRVVVDCHTSVNSMAITVTPYPGNIAAGGNTPRVYTTAYDPQDPAAPAACLFDETTAGLVYDKSFDISDPANLPCGITTTIDPTTNDVDVVAEVKVQHTTSPDVIQQADVLITAKCTFNAANALLDEVSDVQNVDTELQGFESTDIVSPVAMQVQVENPGTGAFADAGATPINLGAKLRLYFFMEDNLNFDSMLVQQCSMQNDDDDLATDFESITLVNSDGCPVFTPGIVTEDHETEDPANFDLTGSGATVAGQAVIVPVKAVKFLKTAEDKVYFECDVLVCPSGSTDCDPPTAATCGAAPGALTVFRGKRSVDSENRVLTTSIRVVTSAVHSNSSKGGSASDVTGDKSDCLEDSRTQTIIAVLGVAVLTLLIACAVIAAFCSRRNRRQKEASTYFDQGSMASTQHLAIPRPKV